MSLIDFTVYTSMFVWILVPFRQYKQKLFWFFVVLAAPDPITTILRAIFNSNSNLVYIFASILMIYTLIDYKRNVKRKIIFFFILTLSSLGLIESKTPNIDLYLTVFLLIVILGIFFAKTVMSLVEYHEIKTFYALLILYQLSNITKILNVFTGVFDAYFYFYITTAFEILIGIFFIIFKQDDPRINFLIKK